MDYIRVVAGVIVQDNKILIARKKKGKFLEFMWEYPGGKVEVNEKDETSLKRELAEEFSIQILIKNYLTESFHDYGKFKINLRAYIVHHLSGDFKLTDHDKIEWVELNELANYKFAPADIPINQYLVKYGI
jgi:8-oxo-dGTP diphosphatase